MHKNLWAWCGVLAPVIMLLAWVLFALLTPNYSHLTNAISELGIRGSPYALAWNISGFMFVGILITAGAWGLHIALRSHAGAMLVPLLVALSGIGWIGLGIFPAAAEFRPSPQTTLHFVMVALNYLAFVLATFVFSFHFRSHPDWQPWTNFLVGMGILAIAAFFIPPVVPTGVSQRIGLGAYFGWLFVVNYALLRKPVVSDQFSTNAL
jgi:hypothetical membrane protein